MSAPHADYSITLADDRTLNASTLLELAGKWAEAEHGPEWQRLTPARQSVEISHALTELNRLTHRDDQRTPFILSLPTTSEIPVPDQQEVRQ